MYGIEKSGIVDRKQRSHPLMAVSKAVKLLPAYGPMFPFIFLLNALDNEHTRTVAQQGDFIKCPYLVGQASFSHLFIHDWLL